jgi:cbb3-type cytochrome oxidase cytochrome c subunit
MAEKKGVGHAYNVDFLNVVFAASSIFLFLSVIWMVWNDYSREWKNTQRQFDELQYQVTQASLQQASRGIDRNKLQQLEQQEAAARKQISANQAKIDDLQKQLDAADTQIFRLQENVNFAKATYDHDRYEFEANRAAGQGGLDAEQASVESQAKALDDLNLALEKAQADRKAVQGQMDQYTAEAGKIQADIDAITAEQKRLQGQLDVLAPSMVKDYFRNAPLLDFMAPTITIRQVILPNLVDDVNFTTIPKMDRCQTCHLAVDKKGFENYPEPFKTHPNLDLYLGSKSPHPIENIGCTVCHEGMGQSVSFATTFHTPSSEEQKKAWEDKYGWEEPELWDYPMLPTKMTEASCAKCHQQQVFIPGAKNLDVAYGTFERAGCYACHKTRGFEDERKPGPVLTHVASKLKPEWVKNWVRDPKQVKPSTWMPRIWYNSNSSSPEDAVRNEVEINAAVDYLFANSDKVDPVVANPPKGDAAKGEQLVKSVGCLGCHVTTETREAAGPHRTFGQPLQNIGNKTTYAWVYDWVKNPKHYNPETFMPNLRLTDEEAADVATYLMTLKGGEGMQAKATPTEKDVDAVLLDYYRASMPSAEAQTELAKLDPQARELALGQKVIGRYGCYSCHEIKGFENVQPIGTELSEEGTKPVSRLDFGFVKDLGHSDRLGWFEHKLRDPRQFDEGRVLNPLDKLRMPNFQLSDVEVQRLSTAIMSFQRQIQPPRAMPVENARLDFIRQGRNFVHRRNCVGCHIIEGDGGDFISLVAEPTLGPPMLTPEGARVQPEWLYAFLQGPIKIRPWLNVRMPTFGFDDPNLNTVIRYFGAVSNSGGPFLSPPQIIHTAAGDAIGKELFTLLKCQQCHVLGAIPADQPTANLAPDLRMAHERLQADWILNWLRQPSAILPGTRMPSFWPDHPKSYYPQLGGDAEAQMRAIRDYLLTFRGGPSPKTTSAN